MPRGIPRPSFAGGVLLGLGLAFFLAATNTLAGWLFVLTGLILALLILSWWSGGRQLAGLTVEQVPPEPIMAGGEGDLILTLRGGQHLVRLLQVRVPLLPSGIPVAEVAAQATITLTLPLSGARRGLFPWAGVTLRTAAPLGLLWRQRFLPDPQTLVVYPRIVTIHQCPVVSDLSRQSQQQRPQPAASLHMQDSEGTTRALRPYRRGDPLRYIHWRSSARYGELRTRELEAPRDSQPLILAVDHRPGWSEAAFEQALSAVASLYRWIQHQQGEAVLWLESGSLSGERAILTALAGLSPTAGEISPPSTTAVLWFTWDPARSNQPLQPSVATQGWWLIGDPYSLWIDPTLDLAEQLQQPLLNPQL